MVIDAADRRPAGPAGAAPALLLAGAAAISSSAIFMTLAHSSAAAVAVVRFGLALPLLGALAHLERRRTGGPLDRRTRWITRAAGAFLAGDMVLWAHAIDAVGAGLATVLANLQVIIVPLLALVLLGERIRRQQLVAVPVMLVGVAAVAGLLDGGAFGSDPAAGVAYGAGSAAFYAGYLFLLRLGGRRARLGSGGSVAGPLFEATLGAAVTALLVTPLVGGFHLGHGWASLGWLAALAVACQAGGWLLITAAVPRVPSGVGSALLLLQPVGALVLGAVVLGQHPSSTQLGGVVLILAGMVVATCRPPVRLRARALPEPVLVHPNRR